MKPDMQKHYAQAKPSYEDDLIDFHRDKGWFYVTPEESRRAFDALQAQIAEEKASQMRLTQRATVDDLFQGSQQGC
jgi:hypothetical protein